MPKHYVVSRGIRAVHVNAGSAVLAVLGSAQRFTIDSDERAISAFIDGIGPTNEGSQKLARLYARDDSSDGVMNSNAS